MMLSYGSNVRSEIPLTEFKFTPYEARANVRSFPSSRSSSVHMFLLAPHKMYVSA